MSTPAGLRILLVDDNEDASESMRMMLEIEGHQVEVALDGASALETAARFNPEVILLDITLPDMDGYAVARQLRATAHGRGALILAVTGYGSDDDVRRSREAGIDRHLVKPIDPAALSRIIRGGAPAR